MLSTRAILAGRWRVGPLGPGWKGDIALKIYTLTEFHVQCEPLAGTLNAPPTDRGESVQTKAADKETAQNVVFSPDLETKGLGDKKPRDLAKGDRVKLSVIAGSQPPIVVTFELSKAPASQRATTQPAAGSAPKNMKPPTTSQPTSQPAN